MLPLCDLFDGNPPTTLQMPPPRDAVLLRQSSIAALHRLRALELPKEPTKSVFKKKCRVPKLVLFRYMLVKQETMHILMSYIIHLWQNYGKKRLLIAFPAGKNAKKILDLATSRGSTPALPVAAPLGSVDSFECNRCRGARAAGCCPWRLSSDRPELETEGIGGAATWHGMSGAFHSQPGVPSNRWFISWKISWTWIMMNRATPMTMETFHVKMIKWSSKNHVSTGWFKDKSQLTDPKHPNSIVLGMRWHGCLLR